MNKTKKTEGTRTTKRTSAKGRTTKSSKNNNSQLSQLYEEPTNGPTFQRKRMESEKKQLLLMADEWRDVMEGGVPSYAADEICSVVGQTKLLTSSKFDQFCGLVDNTEKQLRAEGSCPVKITCNDLDGFWDMMYLQVQQLKEKYRHLKELKENHWRRDVSRREKTNVQVVNKPVKYNAVSRIRDAIRAKRMSMKNNRTDKENNGDVIITGLRVQPTTLPSETTVGGDKTIVESDDTAASTSLVKSQIPEVSKTDNKRKAVSKSKMLQNKNSDSRLDTVEETAPLRRSARLAEKQNARINVRNNKPKPTNFAEINRLKAEKFRRSSFGTVGLLTSHIGKSVSSPRL